MERNQKIETAILFLIVFCLTQGCCSTRRAFGYPCRLTEKQKQELNNYTKYIPKEDKKETIEPDKGDINQIIAKSLGHKYKKPPSEEEVKRQKKNARAFLEEIEEQKKQKESIVNNKKEAPEALAKTKQKKLKKPRKEVKDTWPRERELLLEKIAQSTPQTLQANTQLAVEAAMKRKDVELFTKKEFKTIKKLLALHSEISNQYPNLTKWQDTSVDEKSWQVIQEKSMKLEEWSSIIVKSDIALALQRRLEFMLTILSSVKKEPEFEAPAEAVSPQKDVKKSKLDDKSGLLQAIRSSESSADLQKAIMVIVNETKEGLLWHVSEENLVQKMVFDFSRIKTLHRILVELSNEVSHAPQDVRANLDSLVQAPKIEVYRQRLKKSSELVKAVFDVLEKQNALYISLHEKLLSQLQDKLSSSQQPKNQPYGQENKPQPNVLIALMLTCFGILQHIQGGLSIEL